MRPGLRRTAGRWLMLGLWAWAAGGSAWAQAVTAPVVIGQSLPLSGPGFPIANRVLAGARAAVDSLAKAAPGRPVELVTLDDQGDPERTAENVRLLVQRHGAVAIVNCLGEHACLSAARASQALGVPLVGPLSGAAALRAPPWRHVFTLRPDDQREAQALARQLQAIGMLRVVLLGDGHEASLEDTADAVLKASGLAVQRLRLTAAPLALPAALDEVRRLMPHALLLNLGPASLDALGRLESASLEGLPAMVAAMSMPGLTQLTRLMRQQTVGFTSVVPIPELSSLPLARRFERDIEAFAGPEAMSFEGLSGYMHLRLVQKALARVGQGVAPTPAVLIRAIEGLGETSLDGFALRFGPDRHHGSEHVEIGLRGRHGRLLR